MLESYKNRFCCRKLHKTGRDHHSREREAIYNTDTCFYKKIRITGEIFFTYSFFFEKKKKETPPTEGKGTLLLQRNPDNLLDKNAHI